MRYCEAYHTISSPQSLAKARMKQHNHKSICTGHGVILLAIHSNGSSLNGVSNGVLMHDSGAVDIATAELTMQLHSDRCAVEHVQTMYDAKAPTYCRCVHTCARSTGSRTQQLT